MENASKALIIAGAILLAILLISLGILIFNQAQDTVSNSGMSQAEQNAFNSKFLKYEGKQKGTVVKSLISDVNASNADSNNINAKRTISMSGSYTAVGGTTKTMSGGVLSGTTVTQVLSGDIDTKRTYKVNIKNYSNGCVSQIEVTNP